MKKMKRLLTAVIAAALVIATIPTALAAGGIFSDVPNGAWYADAVDYVYEHGIMNGTSATTFSPNTPMTRAMLVTVLHRAAGSPSAATGTAFSDVPSGAYYMGADLFEITPVTPYTSADLDWTVDGSRVNQEHDNEALRDIALTQTTPANWDEYDTVFIGYPIWWGIAAWPVNNFVKGNDFSGKTVIPFATSSSSGMGQSGTLLEEMANGGTWQSGQRFSSGASSSTVRDWAAGLGL